MSGGGLLNLANFKKNLYILENATKIGSRYVQYVPF